LQREDGPAVIDVSVLDAVLAEMREMIEGGGLVRATAVQSRRSFHEIYLVGAVDDHGKL
jgi:hypothetical protein